MNSRALLTPVLLSLFFYTGTALAQSADKYKIFMDIAHDQVFWNDPSGMSGMPDGQVERVKYMTDEILKTASSVNAELSYLKEDIKPGDLANADLLFIHMPSAMYSPAEVKAITGYLNTGGSLFLVMDGDYHSSLEQTNINDVISPFGIEFGGHSPDTLSGGYTKANLITRKPLKISYHGGRVVNGGIPFSFNNQTEEYPFGVFTETENGGKIIVMGDGMVSLYMTSWQGVDDYQCGEFMHDVFTWLLK